MKISASIYANPNRSLPELVKDLDAHQVDYFHVDSIDDPSVFEDIHHIRQLSQTPIDIHLITNRPAHYVPLLVGEGVEYVTFQYENLTGPDQLPEPEGYKQGLAIKSETPIEVFEAVKDKCQFVLFMATTPGMSGGRFQPENFQRIRSFVRKYPGVQVHVDGGVNDEVSFILRNMGVSAVVSGSFLVKSPSIGASMLQLKAPGVGSHYTVGDFMMPLQDTPRLREGHGTFLNALAFIEQYRMGLVVMQDEEGKLSGLITNADVRRGLLAHPEDFNKIQLSEVINRTPVYAHTQQTVSELLEMIKQIPFPVNYLPVVDEYHKVAGLITFMDLIKGEG